MTDRDKLCHPALSLLLQQCDRISSLRSPCPGSVAGPRHLGSSRLPQCDALGHGTLAVVRSPSTPPANGQRAGTPRARAGRQVRLGRLGRHHSPPTVLRYSPSHLVFVVGGGNSAGQAALHLARYAERVTVVVRAQSLEAGMSHYLIQAVEAAPNIEVRTATTVVGGGGDGHLQQLVLREAATSEDTMVAADAVFVLIGALPQTEWLPAEIARDEHGFLLTGDDVTAETWPLARRPLSLETSMPGVLAAGDVRHASVKRVAAAVGEGSVAVQQVQRLLTDGRLHY